MKKVLFLLFLCAGYSTVQAQFIKLPNECEKILNKSFKGWKLAQIPNEVSEYHKEKKFPFEPNFIKGDWNGDGQGDYAALIEQGTLKNAEGADIGKQKFIVAFVRIKNGYKHFNFDGGDYIQLMRKGSKDYNYETSKNFHYKTDAIFGGIGQAGVSYVWKKGKFIEITTSD
jgi:hypothetical protein